MTVEQLHRIFKLCGSPPEEYWKRSKLPHATIFKPQQPYKRCIAETFRDFPKYSLPLIEMLLAIDPAERQTATAALNSEFFTTEPLACDPSSLPQYPPSKELDMKLRDEEARRLRASRAARPIADVPKKVRSREKVSRGAIPAPDANAEMQANLDKRRMIIHGNPKSKSEKFPPPHEDGAVGFPMESSGYLDSSMYNRHLAEASFSTVFPSSHKTSGGVPTWSGPLAPDPASRSRRKKSQPSRR